MKNGIHIDYKMLREISHESARMAVLEYLDSNGGNITDCAYVFGITRPIVYKTIRKRSEGNLLDVSRRPRSQPKKTKADIEDKVINAKNKTRLGPKRLSIYLKKHEKVIVPYGTIRHILRRNKHKIKYSVKGRRREEERCDHLLIGTLLSLLR